MALKTVTKEPNKNGAIHIKTISRNRYLVKCKFCNNEYEMWASHFYRGSNPCRCYQHHHQRLFSIYTNIKSRCYNPNTPNYQYYGEKNIGMCDEWFNNYDAFEQWALHNGYNDDLSIDRKNYNDNYSPENCRWVTRIGQANNKTNNILFVINNIKMSLKRICEQNNWGYKEMNRKYNEYGYEYVLHILQKRLGKDEVRPYIHTQDAMLEVVE